MKKHLSILCVLAIAILMMFSLSACAAKEQTATLETTEEGGGFNIAVSLTLDAKGDKVYKITQVSSLDYTEAGLTEEDASAYADQLESELNDQISDVDGASYTCVLEGTTIKETFTFDTSTPEQVKQITDAQLLDLQENTEIISFKQSVEQLQQNGWTLK